MTQEDCERLGKTRLHIEDMFILTYKLMTRKIRRREVHVSFKVLMMMVSKARI